MNLKFNSDITTPATFNAGKSQDCRSRTGASKKSLTVLREYPENLSIPRNTRWFVEEEVLIRCREGNIAYLKPYLEQNPADINQLFESKHGPFFCLDRPISLLNAAVNNRQLKTVQFLLDSGANPDLYRALGTDSANPLEMPEPLRTALMTFNPKKRDFMVTALLNANASCCFDEEVLNFLIEQSDSLNLDRILEKIEKSMLTEVYMQNALTEQCASKEDKSAILTILLNNGAKASVKKGCPITPIFQAVRRGNIEHAKLLIARGADVCQFSYDNDGWKQAPIHLAVSSSDNEMFRLLIENGADVEAEAIRQSVYTTTTGFDIDRDGKDDVYCSSRNSYIERWKACERMNHEQKIILHSLR